MVTLFTPVFRLEIGDIDQTRKIWQYLETLEYEDQEEGESDTLSFTVANCPAFSVPKRGASVKLWLGWKEGAMKYFGAFTVDEISGSLNPATMSITAKSADFTNGSTAKQKEDKEWEHLTLASMTQQIAAKHGCKAKVSIDLHYTHIAQTNESDISFLRRLAKDAGGNLTIKDKTFVIAPAGTATRGSTTLRYNECIRGSYSFAEKDNYGSVRTVWWDMEYASESSVTVGSGKPVYKIKKRFNSASEAKAAAENQLSKLKKGQATMDLSFPGDPNMASGVRVTCVDFSPKMLNSTYLVKSCTHSVSRSGWETRISIEKTS